MTWDQVYRECVAYLVMMVAAYAWLLVNGTVGWPW